MADVGTKAEQTLRLRGRQPQAGHLAELGQHTLLQERSGCAIAAFP
jgi:hypothetical protein